MIEEDLMYFVLAKNRLKKALPAYLRNKTIPLDERFSRLRLAGNIIEKSYCVDAKLAVKEVCWYAYFYIEKYQTVSIYYLRDAVYDKILDGQITKEQADEFLEDMLRQGITHFIL